MTYQAQPGTDQHTVIQHLRTLPPGAELSCQEVASLLGLRSAAGLRSKLRFAVEGGALRIRIGGPRFSWYSLGDGTEPAAEPGDERSVAQVDAMAVPSIFAFAAQRHAAPFSTAESSDGRLILQRHGRVIAELTPAEAKTHREFLAKRAQWEMAED